MKKNTYYAVATTIFDDRVIVRRSGTASDYVRPENTFHETPHAHRYIDWFDSEAEADEFVKANTI